MAEEARPQYRELLARMQKPLDTSVIAAALATIPLTIIQRGPGDPLWVNTLDWLVPSYQENALDLLGRNGLHEAGHYTMLIKTVTVPVRNRELSYVEA